MRSRPRRSGPRRRDGRRGRRRRSRSRRRFTRSPGSRLESSRFTRGERLRLPPPRLLRRRLRGSRRSWRRSWRRRRCGVRRQSRSHSFTSAWRLPRPRRPLSHPRRSHPPRRRRRGKRRKRRRRRRRRRKRRKRRKRPSHRPRSRRLRTPPSPRSVGPGVSSSWTSRRMRPRRPAWLYLPICRRGKKRLCALSPRRCPPTAIDSPRASSRTSSGPS